MEFHSISEEPYYKGYDAFEAGLPPPDRKADGDGWKGWHRAQKDAGCDQKSLDKLANQLKALGFTVPN